MAIAIQAPLSGPLGLALGHRISEQLGTRRAAHRSRALILLGAYLIAERLLTR
jgi:hypothetical protein